MRIWSYVVTLTGTLNWREVLPLSKILIYVINEEGLICLHARSYFVLVFKRQAASCQTPIVGLENCLFSRSVYQQCRCTPTFQQLSYWCRFFSLTRGQDRLGIKRKFQVRTEDISVMFLSSVCAYLRPAERDQFNVLSLLQRLLHASRDIVSRSTFSNSNFIDQFWLLIAKSRFSFHLTSLKQKLRRVL